MVAPPPNAPRILVVEDDALVRIVLADTLEDLGFQVELAGSAGEAADKVRLSQGRLDAAILDVGLPDRKGDLLAADLRVAYPDLPIVIATGYEDDVLRNRFSGDSRVAFFAKPYNSLDVIPLLKSLGVRDPAGRAAADS